MDRLEPYKKLLEIICQILEIENDLDLTIYPFLPTKFNREFNSINIQVIEGIGIIELFLNMGHEVFHAKQHKDKTLKVNKEEYHYRSELYKNDTWMMYYYYSVEREAQSFGWILAGFANDLFYKNHPNQEYYQIKKNIYSSMMKLKLSDMTLKKQFEETQQLLDECFDRFYEVYKDLILSNQSSLLSWYKKYISPH